MERAVVSRNEARVLSRAITSASGRENDREAGRSENLSGPIEMRLQEFGRRRRFDGCFGSKRRRHSRGGAQN
jgi:hypothetical protein